MDEMPSLGQVRASGAMWGLELIKGKQQPEPAPKLAREVVRKCREKGLLLLSGGLYRNVLRLLPPLNISEQDLEKCFGVLEEVMRELSNERDAS